MVELIFSGVGCIVMQPSVDLLTRIFSEVRIEELNCVAYISVALKHEVFSYSAVVEMTKVSDGNLIVFFAGVDRSLLLKKKIEQLHPCDGVFDNRCL